MKINQYFTNVDCPREFCCSYCGKNVYVDDIKDKRVKYCCRQCEKQYWRAKSKENYLYKKRARETSYLKNYSNREMAIKLYKEKKEYEESISVGGTTK